MELMTRRRSKVGTGIRGTGLASCGLILLLALASPAQAIETKAREAILMDAVTGAVLMEKDADVSMPPASMSKIMTAYMGWRRG